MASKNLFASTRGKLVPVTDTVNEAGGAAYQLSPKAALAQLAATGCFGGTYYTSAESQLDEVKKLVAKIDAEFIGKTAIFARQRGYMKDMPAFLVAHLATDDVDVLKKVFPKVIGNGRMLRNFVQIVRSGATGRKSLGYAPKKLVQKYLDEKSDEGLFRDSVGNDPSLADVIKMVHPKPKTDSRSALFAYLIGKEHNPEDLPEIVKEYQAFKRGDVAGNPPAVEFRLLTALPLTKEHWVQIAKDGRWHQTRMNLNTYLRQGVFETPGMDKVIAAKLKDAEAIKAAKVFPYQLLIAYMNASQDVPFAVREALQDAMEIAVDNVPVIEGKVFIFPDVSYSMGSSVTGHRGTATSKVRCVDISALVAAAVLRKNPTAEVIPFEGSIRPIVLNPRDTIMTNAEKLAGLLRNGTNCWAPLRHLNQTGKKGDLIIYVSDNESWMDRGYRQTGTMEEWTKFKINNPKAKLVCLDIQPYTHTQAKEREDILNIGGFSDKVFEIVSEFANGTLNADHWVGVIDAIEL